VGEPIDELSVIGGLRGDTALLGEVEMFNTPESRAAATALRAAEAEVEAVTMEINACLPPRPKPEAGQVH